jgi:hypothetical protein
VTKLVTPYCSTYGQFLHVRLLATILGKNKNGKLTILNYNFDKYPADLIKS